MGCCAGKHKGTDSKRRSKGKGQRLNEEDELNKVSPRATKKVVMTSSSVSMAKEEDSQPSTTTLNELPLELLDAILEKSLLHWMLHSSTDQRDEDIIRALTSVDFCWLQRITRRRSKKRFWKQLKGDYQPSTTTLNELPMVLLDAILEKSLLHWMLHSSTDQRDEDIIRALTSVDFCWLQRITRRRSKKRFWKQLKGDYQPSTTTKLIMDNGEDNNWRGPLKKTVDASNGLVKGSKAFHALTGSNYRIMFDSSSVVNVIDKTIGRSGGSISRLHRPNPGAAFNHLNINPKVSKILGDPHIPLPPGGLTAVNGVATFCKYANKVNKVAVPIAIAIDTVRVGVSVYDDYNNGTTRNTVETAANIAGGWGGGVAGAFGGAAAGTAILPGIGTIIGSIIGGLSGGIGGSLGASAAAEAIGDAVDYGVEERVCDECGKKFKVHKYKGEKSHICPKCSKPVA